MRMRPTILEGPYPQPLLWPQVGKTPSSGWITPAYALSRRTTRPSVFCFMQIGSLSRAKSLPQLQSTLEGHHNSRLSCMRVPSALWKERAMMTQRDFLDRFQRQPDGTWRCTSPIRIDGPNGPFVIKEGARFSPGALLLGFDLARELDRMAARDRLESNPGLRQAG